MEMRPAYSALLGGALLFCAAGCRSSDQVEMGAADNGSEVALNVGETLMLGLGSTPTTGYRWELCRWTSPS